MTLIPAVYYVVFCSPVLLAHSYVLPVCTYPLTRVKRREWTYILTSSEFQFRAQNASINILCKFSQVSPEKVPRRNSRLHDYELIKISHFLYNFFITASISLTLSSFWQTIRLVTDVPRAYHNLCYIWGFLKTFFLARVDALSWDFPFSFITVWGLSLGSRI